MAIFTIAGLTLQEAWRRRTLLGALLLGLLVLGLSLLLILMRAHMVYLISTGEWKPERYAREYPRARILITLMCLFFIRILCMLFAVLLAGGAVSGEIDQGVLGVILAKPVPRWKILLGKWIGLNLIAFTSAVIWTFFVWISIRIQVGFDLDIPLEQVLLAGPLMGLYAVLACTLTLTLSTVCQRVLGTSIAVALIAFSWADGVFNFLGEQFQVPALYRVADIGGLLLPQGYVAWWVRTTTEEVLPNPLGDNPVQSSQFARDWGQAHLHFAHLDAIYLCCYVLILLGIGILLFERREVT